MSGTNSTCSELRHSGCWCSHLPLGNINYLLCLRAERWPQESGQSNRHRISEPVTSRLVQCNQAPSLILEAPLLHPRKDIWLCSGTHSRARHFLSYQPDTCPSGLNNHLLTLGFYMKSAHHSHPPTGPHPKDSATFHT